MVQDKDGIQFHARYHPHQTQPEYHSHHTLGPLKEHLIQSQSWRLYFHSMKDNPPIRDSLPPTHRTHLNNLQQQHSCRHNHSYPQGHLRHTRHTHLLWPNHHMHHHNLPHFHRSHRNLHRYHHHYIHRTHHMHPHIHQYHHKYHQHPHHCKALHNKQSNNPQY